MESISLKALNPDNDSEVAQLAQLFERVCPGTFPVTGVYEPRFWKTHAGARFASLLAVQGKRVLAHLAIRPDRGNPTVVQIYLPVCDPDFAGATPSLHHQMVDQLNQLGRRQGWRVLYCYVIEDLPQMHFFANEVLGASEVAIWPECLPAAPGTGPRRHVVVTQKLFSPSVLDQESLKGEAASLFVPRAHRRMAELLYSNLGLQAAFCRSTGRARPRRTVVSALPADRRAVETRTYRQTGITLSCVEPSLIASPQESLWQLVGGKFAYHYVALNLHDEKTPEFSAALEGAGFYFCGLLPFLRGKDSIVYSNRRLDAQASPLCQRYSLARYLESFDFGEVEHGRWNGQEEDSEYL